MSGIVAMIVGLLGLIGVAFGARRIGRKVDTAKTRAEVATVREVAEVARGKTDEVRLREFAEADKAEREYRAQIKLDAAKTKADLNPNTAGVLIKSIDDFPMPPSGDDR